MAGVGFTPCRAMAAEAIPQSAEITICFNCRRNIPSRYVHGERIERGRNSAPIRLQRVNGAIIATAIPKSEAVERQIAPTLLYDSLIAFFDATINTL
jgi:hypothetical protein